MSLNTNVLYRFDEYELAPSRRVLLRNDEPVSLTPKAFDVLVCLVSKPGRVVSKDEIFEAVWPGSFVEEGNLAQHISALRRALGDNSSLIATVSGRGYQFTAKVQTTQAETAMEAFAPHDQQQGEYLVQRVQEVTHIVYEDKPAHPESPLLLTAGAAPSKAWNWQLVTLAVFSAALIALASLLAWRHFFHTVPVSDVVLADFANNTGDANFDNTLGRALEIDLAQTPFLNLLSRHKVKATLLQMQRKGDEPLTPELAREVCERNNAQAVLHGAIASFGSKYLLTLSADSCVSGQRIAGYKATASTKEEVLAALDEVAGRVRKQLGESAATLERFQIPISQATTPSLEALRDYSQARERFEHGDWRATQQLLTHAIALDPGFATAYAGLGAAYSNRGDITQAAAYFKKGFDLRDRATERERLQIEISYHTGFDHDLEEAIRSLLLMTRIYPNYEIGWGNLSNQYAQLGEYNKAVAAGEEAFRLNPHSSYVDIVLAHAYLAVGRYADAQRICNAAIADGKGTWEIHSILYQTAFARQDAAAIASEGQWGIDHDHAAAALYDLGRAAAAAGKLRAASDFFNRAHAEALRSGDADFADLLLSTLAHVQFEFGDAASAAATLKQLKGDGGDPGGVAVLQAATGDRAAAKRFVADHASRELKDTRILSIELPQLRAGLALADHKPAEAVQLLETARAYQLCDFLIPSLRAQAETDAGMLEAATADYRLILDNQGADPVSPLYPLAHLGLARVLALEKKNDEARQQYRVFLDAWKGADPNLPLLLAAKSEMAKLQ